VTVPEWLSPLLPVPDPIRLGVPLQFPLVASNWWGILIGGCSLRRPVNKGRKARQHITRWVAARVGRWPPRPFGAPALSGGRRQPRGR
jgi:hypothetical protein